MVIVPRSADKGFTVAFQPSWDMVFTMVFSVASVMVYDIVLEVPPSMIATSVVSNEIANSEVSTLGIVIIESSANVKYTFFASSVTLLNTLIPSAPFSPVALPSCSQDTSLS